MNSEPTSDPWIGRLLGDRQRYRLDKSLGGSYMGEVFLAIDTLLGQQVALKLIKDPLVGSGEPRKRFEREVAVCAALKSDHIVEVSDYGMTAEGYPFYVMEYLQGQTLGQLLQRQKRLDVERTMGIITQVCEGLQLAHKGVSLWRNGATVTEHVKVVHGDLKPDNIFLVPTALGEVVKILDFGIAKIRDDFVEHKNLISTFIGAFRYSAPEQVIAALDVDERADIYSLGVIIYEMLSGVDPFYGIKARSTTGVSWAMAHTSKLPVPLRSQPATEQLSPELEAVVMRCLQKVPNERFASIDELNRALQVAAMSGTSDTDIARSLTLSGQGFNQTIPTPLTQSGLRVPDTTIAQFPPSPGQVVPDATITQVPHPGTVGSLPLTPPKQGVSNDSIDQTTPDRQASRSLPTRLWLPVGASIAIGIAMIAEIYACFQFQPGATQVLEEIKKFETQKKYDKCITKAEKVGQDSSIYNDAQRLLNECRFENAKKLAVSKNFEDAIATAKKIPENSPLHANAQALIEQWSKQVDNSI